MFEIHFFTLSYDKRFRKFLVLSNAALIRRVITLSSSLTMLDRADLQQKYKEMGIEWDKLNLWAAFIYHNPGMKLPITGHEDWLCQPKSVKELEHLGIYKNQRHWMNWVIRNGSTRLSSRFGARR